VSELSAAFSSLEPTGKAMFLARVAHMATVAAREAYAPSQAYPEQSYEQPDAIILRDANNFVHRVTGYIPHVLAGTELAGQDASVMAMIVEHFRARHLEPYLAQWLGLSD
jgi:hypothetical protein